MTYTRFIRAFALLLLACIAGATPPLTTIQDTIYNADGTVFSGTAEISWRSFTASDGSFVVMNIITLRVVNGSLRVKLVPTTNATTAASYTVRYTSDGRTMATETWSVPASANALRVADVRVASASSSGGGTGGGHLPSTINITDVAGLSDALNNRPIRGLGYFAGRAAIVDDTGNLSSASGDPGDCIHVDGTAGPCGTGGGTGSTITFVDKETPSGAVNGLNATFTLAGAPSPAASLHLFRNGLLMKEGFDYTINGATISFVAASIPQSGDTLLASYRK